MTLHDEMEAALDEWCGERAEVSADAEETFRAILARHPEADVSDREREGMMRVLRDHEPPTHIADDLPEDEFACCADALIAAGYRNRPMPSVDEVACVVADVMRWEDFVAPDVIEPSADCYRIATAVLTLFTKESE